MSDTDPFHELGVFHSWKGRMVRRSNLSVSEIAQYQAGEEHARSMDTCSEGLYDERAYRARGEAHAEDQHIPSPRCSLAGTHSQCQVHQIHSPRVFELTFSQSWHEDED
jgi:hypothetical protein